MCEKEDAEVMIRFLAAFRAKFEYYLNMWIKNLEKIIARSLLFSAY